ncbi:hypothetical protein ACLRAC_10100, partial [Gallibacterium anatis]
VSFAYFALHKQRKVGRPLGETKVSMQGEAAVKWGRPLGETQTCHRKMKSFFEKNQSINARRSRKKIKSIFRSKPPQKTKPRSTDRGFHN